MDTTFQSDRGVGGAPSQAQERPGPPIIGLFVAIAVLVVVALVWLNAYRTRQDVMEQATTELISVSRLFGVYSEAAFHSADTALRQAIRIATGSEQGRLLPPTRDLHEILQDLVQPLPFVYSVWFGDADGTATLTSREFPAPSLSAAERDYFRAHADAPRDIGLYVSPLPENAYSDDGLIMLSRAIRPADGRMTGFATTGIGLRHLDELYQRVGSTFPVAIGLLREDGTVLYWRGPGADVFQPGARPSEAELALPGTLSWRTKVAGLPVTAVAALAESQIGEALHQVVARHILYLVAALVPIAVLGVLAIHRTRQAHRANADLAALNRNLERRVAQRTGELARHEEELRETLRVKDLLLHEVDHRVKNSLQLISSFLYLQKQAAGPEKGAMLDEVQRRIHALSRLHEHLYRADTPNAVRFDEYLEAVALDTVDSSGTGHRVRVEAEPLTLTADVAIPLGIIATELLMNALKHAYGEEKGTVLVRLKSGPTAILDVEDRGRGMPEVAGKTGLGMTVVSGLASQLRATLDVQALSPGTRIRLALPLAE